MVKKIVTLILEMKIIFAILMGFVTFIMGCSRDGVQPANNSINGTWKVVNYKDLDNNKTFTRSSPESELAAHSNDIVITLKKEGNTLHLKGCTVANEVFGTFVFKAADGLHCISFGGTKVGEPNWGSWFWDAMNSAQSYQLEGDILTVYYNFQDNHDGKWSVNLVSQ